MYGININMKSIIVFIMCILAQAYCAWVSISTPSYVYNDVCLRGSNTYAIRDYNGIVYTTLRNNLSWLPKNTGQEYVMDVCLGENDDMCIVNELNQAKCNNYGMTTWTTLPSLPSPHTSENQIYIHCSGYANGGVVITTFQNNAFLYINGSFVRIGGTQQIKKAVVATDGTVIGLDTSGYLWMRNSTTNTWGTVPFNSAYDLVQIEIGTSLNTLVAVSNQVNQPSMRIVNGQLSTFSSTNKHHLSYGGGGIIGCDSLNMYLWQ